MFSKASKYHTEFGAPAKISAKEPKWDTMVKDPHLSITCLFSEDTLETLAQKSKLDIIENPAYERIKLN